MMYKTYVIIKERDSFKGNYYCRDCEFIRLKEVFSEKYSNREEIDRVINKRKIKWMEIYGVDNPMKSDIIKEKMSNTSIERYVVKWHISSDIVRYKSIETMLDRYGVKYAILNKSSREKMINTTIERYGVRNHMLNETVALKAGQNSLASKIKNGKAIDKSDSSKWMNYKSLVIKRTRRNKKKLFEKWDGTDYYDNEYIKDNLLVSHNNSNFPCVDHKISILQGFLNNIDIYEISDINNLCITKRKINSEKSSTTEVEFKLKKTQ